LTSLIIYPFVVGWTLGDGFMSKLGLVDFSGCASIHLVAGFCSLFASITVKPRLGRFEPLAIKKTVGNNELYLSHLQKEFVQNKINQIAKEMPFTRDISLEKQVANARKLLKRHDSDNFYSMNNELANFIGTLMMWFSLCHLYSGYNLTVYRQRY
jgi:ammonia channel protein AmtB